MTHLDEGQLHGYLDGQPQDGSTAGRQDVERHLAECAACRARLEEERGVRDRARAILGTAGPTGLTAPPFEAVLERAAQRQASRSRVRPPFALAWAASLALALTVGWYARSLLQTEAWVGGAGEAARAAGAAQGEMRADAIQAAPPARRQLAQGAPARDEPTQPPPEGTREVASTAAPAVQERPLANLAAAEAKVEQDTRLAPVRVTEAPAPSAVPQILLRRQPRAAAPELAEDVWVTVPPAEAERRLGGPLATIPGLPSLGTSVFGTGLSTVTRTIQVLGPGLTIELVQERTAAPMRERAAVPAAAPQAGRALRDEPGLSVTVQWEGFSVTGRALLPADSLRKLLSRLSRP